MKAVSLLLMILLLFSGCASFHNSAVINTDAAGFATGQYSHSSSGPNGTFAIAGGGGGGSGGGSGFGFGGMTASTGPPPSEAYAFARSVATINYSTRLKSIKYDEAGGIIEYEFGPGLMSMRSDISAPKGAKPSAFGHQPVE